MFSLDWLNLKNLLKNNMNGAGDIVSFGNIFTYYGLSKHVVFSPLALARFCNSKIVKLSHLSLKRR